jgi:hypothetical protein
MENDMKRWLIGLSILVTAVSCAAQSPQASIKNIYEYCGKDKTDPSVVEKMKQLEIDINGDGFKYYEAKSKTDYSHISITVNPQPTYQDIQGIFITWDRSAGLTFEDIQGLVGLTLPTRHSTAIHTDQASTNETQYYVLGQENPNQSNINQVTVTCAKNNYDSCYEIQISCFPFVHPD